MLILLVAVYIVIQHYCCKLQQFATHLVNKRMQKYTQNNFKILLQNYTMAKYSLVQLRASRLAVL